MKIGIVTPYFYPALGGVQEHVFSLYKQLTKSGHVVKIITSHFERGGDIESLPTRDVVRIGKAVPIPMNQSVARVAIPCGLRLKIKRLLDKERFEILHIHKPLAPTLPLPFLEHSRAINIGTFHAYSSSSLGYPLARPFLLKYFRRLHGRICVSQAAKEFVSRYFRGDYRVIPNGVDIQRFNPQTPGIEKYGHGRLNILFVGRLDPRKGLECLLKAFPLILKNHPSARLIVVGGGRPPKRYLGHMDATVAEQVSFEGVVSPEVIPSYYASCDVYCSPATGRESFGIVLLEAMASGVPVVASDIDGYREVIADGKDGLLVRPGDPQAIARAISDLLSNAHARARLGENGRAKALQFSWERVTELIEDYYCEVREKVVRSGTR